MAERHIPKDILINILVRLPAPSLQRLKCVSREWFQIISDPNFAEANLAHQLREEFGCGIIVATEKAVLFIEGSSSLNPNQPRHLKLPGAHGATWVHGCCKGLILFQCTTRFRQVPSLHVANPITGDNVSLPQFHGCCGSLLSASIGCSNSRDIKVVVVGGQCKDALTASAPLKCGVLTLGSTSWREVHIAGPAFLFFPYLAPVFAGGSLHWKYASGILSFDIGSEKFHQTEVTFCSSSTFRVRSRLCELDGCLAFLQGRRQPSDPFFRVWVLRESGRMRYPDMDIAFFRNVWPPEMLSTLSDTDDDHPYICTTIRNGKIILFWHLAQHILHLLAYDVCGYDVGGGMMTKFIHFKDDYFLPYKAQGKTSLKAHISSLVSCSSLPARQKRIGVLGEGPMLASVSNVLGKCLMNFACTIKNMLWTGPKQ